MSPIRSIRSIANLRLRATTIAVISVLSAMFAVVSVAGKPPVFGSRTVTVPIVFTSHNGPAGLTPVLPAPDENWPGTMVERAIPGKLRLLTPAGVVRELTWGKRLADGSTLIDVMSPALSMDATRIVFAGIKSPEDHFRLYEVRVDGGGLRQLTGLASDRGCTEPPYLIFGKDGRRLSQSEREKIDYDDLDPALLPDGRIVFASTRLPRLSLYGGFAKHRATNLWVMNGDGGGLHQITFNLAGERWPYVTKDGRILFSYWSRTLTRAADSTLLSGSDEMALAESDIARGVHAITGALPNNWWPASVNPDGTDFRALSKPPDTAVHARPLFNGNIVYATQADDSFAASPFETGLEQVPPGYIGRASGGRIGPLEEFPLSSASPVPGPGALAVAGGRVGVGEYRNAPWAVSPSALPPHGVVFSYAQNARANGQSPPTAPDYGIYMAQDDWQKAARLLAPRATPQAWRINWSPASYGTFERLIGLTKVVDFPGTCEAEAQAVYPRRCLNRPDQSRPEKGSITFQSGRRYEGPVGGISTPDLYANPVPESPGQKTDTGQGPVYAPPPSGLIKAIEFYAVNLARDKNGLATADLTLEPVATVDVDGRSGFHIKMPAGMPLMQVGKDRNGKLATWITGPADSRGKSAHLAAFAGDHFGYATQGVPASFCVGCHAGHTVLPGSSIADILGGGK